MDTAGFKAIVEMAEMIKNPKALQEAAAYLSEAFKLSDEELKRRDEYNLLVQNANQLKAETSAALAENNALMAKLDEERKKHAEAVAADETRLADISSALDREQRRLEESAAALLLRESDILHNETDVAVKLQAAVAKENELRVREEKVAEREEKMKKVVEAMG